MENAVHVSSVVEGPIVSHFAVVIILWNTNQYSE